MARNDVEVKIKADGTQFNREFTKAKRTLGDFKDSIGGIGAGIAAGFTVAAVKHVIDVNREFERLNAQLVTVTGSALMASQAFAGIKQFAAETPYSVQEVTTAFTKLTALGLEPSERALRSYGNTASAMGKDLDQMIEAVADASTGEFERLKEFGIKARSQGENVSFTFQGVTTTVKKSSEEIEGYLLKLGETKFGDGMALQANTLNGALSNLGDAWDNLIDKMLSDSQSSSIQDWISGLADTLRYISTEGIGHFQGAFVAGIASVENAFISLRATSEIVWETIKATGQAAIDALKQPLVDFLERVAKSLDALGAEETAAKLRGVADSLRPQIAAYEELGKKIASIREERDKEIAVNDEAVMSTLKSIAANKDEAVSLDELAKKLKKKTEEKKATTKYTKEQVNALDKLQAKYDEVFKAAQDYANTQAELKTLYDAGRISLEDYTDALNDYLNAKEGFTEETEEKVVNLTKTVTSETNAMADTWGNWIDRLTARAFDGFDNIGKMFESMLKNMAATAIANTIKVTISAGMSGGSGGSYASYAQDGYSLYNFGSAAYDAYSGFAGSGASIGGYAMNYGASMAGGASSSQAAMLAAQTGEFGTYGASATYGSLTGGSLSSSISAAAGAAASAFAVAFIGWVAYKLATVDPKENSASTLDLGTGVVSPIGGEGILDPRTSEKTDAALAEINDLWTKTSDLLGGVNLKMHTRIGDSGAYLATGDLNTLADTPYSGTGAIPGLDWIGDYQQQFTKYASLDAMLGAGIDAIVGAWSEEAGGLYDGIARLVAGFDDLEQKAATLEHLVGAIDSGQLTDDMLRMVAAFDGSHEALDQYAGAILSLGKVLSFDAPAEYAKAAKDANRTLFDVAQDQYDAVMDLAKAYDGSLESTLTLTAATEQRYNLELQMLAQINAASEASAAILAGTRESILTSVMSEEEKFNYYKKQADNLTDSLSTMVDPQRIAETVAQINSIIGTTYGLLGDEGKEERNQEYLDYIDEIARLAQERYDAAEDQVVTQHQELVNSIDDAMARASAAMVDAADTMKTAADDMVIASKEPTRIELLLPNLPWTTGGSTTEVGGDLWGSFDGG